MFSGSGERFDRLLGGRDVQEESGACLLKTTKAGIPLKDVLFLRPNKSAHPDAPVYWRGEVVGLRSWDPVREVSAWCTLHEGWSDHTRTLQSYRHTLETGLVRCNTPLRIASGFIGHEVMPCARARARV